MIRKLSIWHKKINDLIEKKIENHLKIFLLPKDDDDNKNAIVEIRAGTEFVYLFCAFI